MGYLFILRQNHQRLDNTINILFEIAIFLNWTVKSEQVKTLHMLQKGLAIVEGFESFQGLEDKVIHVSDGFFEFAGLEDVIILAFVL